MSNQISDITALTRLAKALVDCVAFDDCGQVIGTQLVGGNGGLLSRETIKAADTLRLALSQHEAQAANLPDGMSDVGTYSPMSGTRTSEEVSDARAHSLSANLQRAHAQAVMP